jgi:uncharacterized delta-60 repeat protein
MNTPKRSHFRNVPWKALCLTLALSLFTYTVALAAAGDLDTSFGDNGTVTTNIGGTLVHDYGQDVAVQSDGKIVVVGDHYNESGTNDNFALVRYNKRGKLDRRFKGNGIVSTNFGGYDRAMGVALQSDSKIVVAGETCNSNDVCDVAVARYNTRGGLDRTFSGDGKVITTYGKGDNGSLGGVAIQSNGRIVVAGYMYNGDNYDMAVYRFNTDGSRDTSFSGDGRAKINFGSGKNDYAFSVAIQSDGKIVVAGRTCDKKDKNCDFAVARLTTQGVLDNTFSRDGRQTTSFGGSDIGRAVALQSDGKIVVAGYKETSGDGLFALARYKTNGNLDTSFSGDGKVLTNLVSGVKDAAYDVAIQSNGKIVAVGMVGTGETDLATEEQDSRDLWVGLVKDTSNPRDFAVVRYNTNGALDRTFSSDGKVATDFNNSDDFAWAVALQSDGKIVVAGRSFVGLDWDFATARYLP